MSYRFPFPKSSFSKMIEYTLIIQVQVLVLFFSIKKGVIHHDYKSITCSQGRVLKRGYFTNNNPCGFVTDI